MCANSALDSIAGQMAALKGGDTAGSPTTKRKVRKPVEDESSDGSNTEGVYTTVCIASAYMIAILYSVCVKELTDLG